MITTKLFDLLFGNRPKPQGEAQTVQLVTAYQPTFHKSGGDIYASELVRAAIGAIATHISKLAVTTQGSAKPALQRKLSHGPNQLMSWSQFLYRLATILYVHNTAFIVPVFDQYGEISGIYPALPERCELVQYGGTLYLRYEFDRNEKAAIELDACGIMTRFQYRSDLFGESNQALLPTMDLISIQNQGIEEGVKNSATYRFMATLTNWSTPDDLSRERMRFTENNFAKTANGGGVLLWPNTYKDVKQLDNKPFVADADTMKAVRDSVYEYFGVNEDVLTNAAYGDKWAAFYAGAIEPFAIKLSEAMTRMVFTQREINGGNAIKFTANRLQYMSVGSKIAMAQQLGDRGILTIDEIRELFNYDPLPDGTGQHVPIRGEYYFADEGKEEKQDE